MTTKEKIMLADKLAQKSKLTQQDVDEFDKKIKKVVMKKLQQTLN